VKYRVNDYDISRRVTTTHTAPIHRRPHPTTLNSATPGATPRLSRASWREALRTPALQSVSKRTGDGDLTFKARFFGDLGRYAVLPNHQKHVQLLPIYCHHTGWDSGLWMTSISRTARSARSAQSPWCQPNAV